MLSFIAQCHHILIPIIAQIEDAFDTDNFADFLDIAMDSTNDHNELNKYLSQPLERVRDPIAWWWKHQVMFPTLSAMAFDYLSIPGASFTDFNSNSDGICSNLNCCRATFLTRPTALTFHTQSAFPRHYALIPLLWRLVLEGASSGKSVIA
jgi:hypothetical protein